MVRTPPSGSRACARPRTRSARPSAPSATTTARRCTRCACTRAGRGARPQRDHRSATAATSSPTPGASSIPTSPAAGWTRGRSAAWAPGPATRSRPSSRIRTARSCCCSATAPSASAAWSSTRSRATASNVVGVMGNNGIWALEKHPMEFLYGYSVAAELRPEHALRPDRRGARRPRRARRAPGRAAPGARARLRAGAPALVNVLTDPTVAYPRRSNLRLTRGGRPRRFAVRRSCLAPRCRRLPRRRRLESGKPPGGGFQSWPRQDGQGYVPCRGRLGGSSGGRRRFDAASPEPMRPAAGATHLCGTSTPSPAERLSAL